MLWIQQTTVSVPSSSYLLASGTSSLLQGECLTSNLFTLVLSCLVYFYFVLFVSFIKNLKKLVTCFCLAVTNPTCFSLKMEKPEIEVRSFKQQGGESLKDAWYRINDSHRRCTKKYSTLILLRNFMLVSLARIDMFLTLLHVVIFWEPQLRKLVI